MPLVELCIIMTAYDVTKFLLEELFDYLKQRKGKRNVRRRR